VIAELIVFISWNVNLSIVPFRNHGFSFVDFSYCYLVMGAHRIFSRGGQFSGLWMKVPVGSRDAARQQVVKIMLNNSSTEHFAMHKNTTTFPEGASVPPCP